MWLYIHIVYFVTEINLFIIFHLLEIHFVFTLGEHEERNYSLDFGAY